MDAVANALVFLFIVTFLANFVHARVMRDGLIRMPHSPVFGYAFVAMIVLVAVLGLLHVLHSSGSASPRPKPNGGVDARMTGVEAERP